MVEILTVFSYLRVSMVLRVKRELATCLVEDGHASVAEAVGAVHRR